MRQSGLLFALLAVSACSYDWEGVAASANADGGQTTSEDGGAVPAAGGVPSSGGSEDGAGFGGVGGSSGSFAGGIGGTGSQTGGAGGSLPGGAGGTDSQTGGAGGSAVGGSAGNSTGGQDTCPGNLLANPGFESALDGWEVLEESDGSKHELRAQGEVTTSGVAALEVDTTGVVPASSSTYRLVVASAPVEVVPGDRLHVALMAQAEVGNRGAPSVGLLFSDESSQAVPSASPPIFEVTAEEITQLSGNAAVPAGAARVRVVFILPNNAVLFVDDACLMSSAS